MITNFLAHPHDFSFQRLWWKNWYNLFTSKFQKIDLSLMNYGYTNRELQTKPLTLNSHEERERYCINLYHYVASAIDLRDLDVLEVGCGRGGGASYLKRYLKPNSLTGIDFSQRNINFCQQNHQLPGLYFCLGDAEALPFKDLSFDIIINIESSHSYKDINKFFTEVYRILQPQGYFLFADFRKKEAITSTQRQLKNSGFQIVKYEVITANVIEAMNLENQKKLEIIKARVPKYLHDLTYWIVRTKGSPVYEAFKQGNLEYFYYVLEKN